MGEAALSLFVVQGDRAPSVGAGCLRSHANAVLLAPLDRKATAREVRLTRRPAANDNAKRRRRCSLWVYVQCSACGERWRLKFWGPPGELAELRAVATAELPSIPCERCRVPALREIAGPS